MEVLISVVTWIVYFILAIGVVLGGIAAIAASLLFIVLFSPVVLIVVAFAIGKRFGRVEGE